MVDVDEQCNNDEEPDKEMINDLVRAALKDDAKLKFKQVLEDLNLTLCPGSVHSKFSFVVRLLCIKPLNKISNTTFNGVLRLMCSSFPKAPLPSTYAEAKKYLRDLGLGYDKIHVCWNNCVLFRGDYAKHDSCQIVVNLDGKIRKVSMFLIRF